MVEDHYISVSTPENRHPQKASHLVVTNNMVDKFTRVLVVGRAQHTLSPKDENLLESIIRTFEIYYMLEDRRHPLGYSPMRDEQASSLEEDRKRHNEALLADSRSPLAGVVTFRQIPTYRDELDRGIITSPNAQPRMKISFKDS